MPGKIQLSRRAAPTYAIPFERAFSALLKRLARGWEIAGITRLSTGFPIGVLVAFDQSLRGTQELDTPNFTGSVQYLCDQRGTL